MLKNATKVKQFYTPLEVSHLLIIQETTVREYIREGLIKAVKIGSKWRIPAKEYNRICREGLNLN